MSLVRELYAQLQDDHPDFAELYNILDIAAQTWPRFGISAGELSEMDDVTLEMIRLASGQ